MKSEGIGRHGAGPRSTFLTFPFQCRPFWRRPCCRPLKERKKERIDAKDGGTRILDKSMRIFGGINLQEECRCPNGRAAVMVNCGNNSISKSRLHQHSRGSRVASLYSAMCSRRVKFQEESGCYRFRVCQGCVTKTSFVVPGAKLCISSTGGPVAGVRLIH